MALEVKSKENVLVVRSSKMPAIVAIKIGFLI